MYPVIFHVYGPFSIQSYGLAIVIGILIFYFFATQDKKLLTVLSENQLINTILYATIGGFIGAKLWFLFSEWQHIERITELFSLGGLSSLGAILGILITATLYLKILNQPLLPILDRLSLYAPLIMITMRIGCFLAGCCYGLETDLPWGITYTNTECFAPLCVQLHPTQLYSAFALSLVFLTLYFAQSVLKKPGELFSLLLFLLGLERFLLDFIRGDRSFLQIPIIKLLSLNQWLSLIIVIASLIAFLLFRKNHEQ